MLHLALTAGAVLTLLIAIRVLFTSGKNGNAGRQKLGFGFSLLTAGLWVYVLRHYLGELGPALRLGGGLLLCMPAISALARPGKTNIIRAVVGLMLAILLAGPVVSNFWSEYGPDGRSDHTRTVQQQLDKADALRSEFVEEQAALQKLERTTRAELQQFGGSWEEIEGNADALDALQLFGNIREELRGVEETIASLDAQTKRLKESLATEASPPRTEESTALEALRRKLEARGDSTDSGLVEKHLREQQLRELFDRELAAD